MNYLSFRYGLLSIGCTALASCTLQNRETSLHTNLIVILVDDMGYGDLGCYGNKEIRTPNIDRMAAEGIRFTDFHSNAPVCTPTRAALLTGRYQQRAGLQEVIQVMHSCFSTWRMTFLNQTTWQCNTPTWSINCWGNSKYGSRM